MSWREVRQVKVILLDCLKAKRINLNPGPHLKRLTTNPTNMNE